MEKKLTKNEYVEILKYYQKDVPNNLKIKELKQMAENLVAKKLCKCIKEINKDKHKDGENRSIAICKNVILLKKGITDSGFRCKVKRPYITLKKSSNNKKSIKKNNTKKHNNSRK